MRNFFPRKFTLPVVMIIVASAIAISAVALSRRGRMAPPTASSKDPRTLDEKAKRGHGKVIANLDFNKAAQQASLADMVAHSESIVIVTTDSNVCKLSDDGKVVRTLYRARVEDVLKGHLQAGGNITVSLPGGKVGFADGSTAEVQTVWFKKMVNNRRYLLFLADRQNADTFIPTGGPQGVFEIPADGSGVLSHSGLSNDAMRQYAGKKIQPFLTQIRQAIEQGKKK
jgi:hypothetical protein